MISNGIDMVYVKRIEKLKNETNFLKKVFTINELEYIQSKNSNIQTIAGLFASKEAFLKAFKKGINDYDLKDIEISHDQNNAPFIILHNKALNECKFNSLSLSISHDGDYAIAIVLVSM